MGLGGQRRKMYVLVFLAVSLHYVAVSGQSRCSEKVCLPSNYSKSKLPAETQNKVSITFDLEEISKIDDWSSSITFSMYFNVEWNEPRLILGPQFGTKKPGAMEPLSSGYLDKMWLPNIFVDNLKSYKVTEVFRKLAGVWVDSDKNILYSQAATVTFFCPLNFKNFPLDSQTCVFRVGSYSYDDERMSFNTKHYGNATLKQTFSQQTLPLQYDVGQC